MSAAADPRNDPHLAEPIDSPITEDSLPDGPDAPDALKDLG